MSATKPATRKEFIEYCLRRLGSPVIQINVADEQVEDLVDEGLEFFQRNHYDGSEHVFLPVVVTAKVKQKKYFEVDDSIITINNMIETGYSLSQFTVDYQLIASAIPFSLMQSGMLDYAMALEYREMFKMVVAGGKTKPIRFNRHTNRLYVDMNWASIAENTVLMAECYKVIDPNEYEDAWNDPFLKEYVTSLIKRQWGNNLRKLRNVQMMGGVTIDADGILSEAEEEISNLKERVQLEFQEPLNFFMG